MGNNDNFLDWSKKRSSWVPASSLSSHVIKKKQETGELNFRLITENAANKFWIILYHTQRIMNKEVKLTDFAVMANSPPAGCCEMAANWSWGKNRKRERGKLRKKLEASLWPPWNIHRLRLFYRSFESQRIIEYGYIRSQNESNNVHNSMTQLAKDQIILVNKNNNSKHK